MAGEGSQNFGLELEEKVYFCNYKGLNNFFHKLLRMVL